MARKLTPVDRKKLLKQYEDGVPKDQLKKNYDILDNRTLKKHLLLADQEREVQLAKRGVLKDRLALHFDEIERCIQEWKDDILVPPISQIRSETTFIIHSENKPLFASLHEHLPFGTLWDSYDIWKDRYTKYISACQRLRSEIAGAWKINKEIKLNPDFAQPILERLAREARKKFQYKIILCEGHADNLFDLRYQALVVDGYDDLTPKN